MQANVPTGEFCHGGYGILLASFFVVVFHFSRTDDDRLIIIFTGHTLF